MKLFILECKLTDEEYIENVREYDVVGEKGIYINYNCFGNSDSYVAKDTLDQFLIGKLISEEPTVNVYTMNSSKVELYKEQIKEKIYCSLLKRNELINKQIKTMKNYI